MAANAANEAELANLESRLVTILYRLAGEKEPDYMTAFGSSGGSLTTNNWEYTAQDKSTDRVCLHSIQREIGKLRRAADEDVQLSSE